jgi:hypothetical protein
MIVCDRCHLKTEACHYAAVSVVSDEDTAPESELSADLCDGCLGELKETLRVFLHPPKRLGNPDGAVDAYKEATTQDHASWNAEPEA